MVARTWIAGTAVALAIAGALAGCSTGENSCVAPHASVPKEATAGSSITLSIETIYKDCNDSGQWFFGDTGPKGHVTVTLQTYDGGDTPSITASVTAPVDDDAKATVVLEIPANASGTYDVAADGSILGAVDVVPG